MNPRTLDGGGGVFGGVGEDGRSSAPGLKLGAATTADRGCVENDGPKTDSMLSGGTVVGERATGFDPTEEDGDRGSFLRVGL
mmetsp:Transcript_12729/g.18071  ORF Transcript_12729/g.18071 Transcript_12729/m.18071 type:complete len:82 (+) Transcript_12729:1731-1976(+)